MSFEIRIPGLGAGMNEGKLVAWHVADGATVREGDLLYTLESEKTAQDVDAPGSGTLKIIGVEEEIYPVGELIGTIG
jgi:pyruvate/2-oxoglutarate dehydrogenase complex dihydrolipoamide acyltransferase (E2) component